MSPEVWIASHVKYKCGKAIRPNNVVSGSIVTGGKDDYCRLVTVVIHSAASSTGTTTVAS